MFFTPLCSLGSQCGGANLCVEKCVFQMFLGIQETTNAAFPHQTKVPVDVDISHDSETPAAHYSNSVDG